jgi:hypothetical protein
LLFGEGIIVRGEQALVQDVGDGADPALMEMMDDSGIDSRPIMDRHERPVSPRSEVSVDDPPPS